VLAQILNKFELILNSVSQQFAPDIGSTPVCQLILSAMSTQAALPSRKMIEFEINIASLPAVKNDDLIERGPNVRFKRTIVLCS
jgi:hypothetical protein